MPSAQLHAAAIDQFTREFNDGATSALAAVSTTAARMKGSAEKMSHVAAQRGGVRLGAIANWRTQLQAWPYDLSGLWRGMIGARTGV